MYIRYNFALTTYLVTDSLQLYYIAVECAYSEARETKMKFHCKFNLTIEAARKNEEMYKRSNNIDFGYHMIMQSGSGCTMYIA